MTQPNAWTPVEGRSTAALLHSLPRPPHRLGRR